jgi:tetratricopeptide (TPR) repeat protein
VTWLAQYFLGKIAWKNRKSAEEILSLYHKSALKMEEEGYIYPPKINRSKQVNLEPLEIHYRVHVYALKLAQEAMKNRLTTPSSQLTRNLKVALNYLNAFAEYGVAKKAGGSGDAFYAVANVLENDGNEDDISHLVSNHFLSVYSLSVKLDDVVDIVDITHTIEEMSIKAFEAILSKFPHYKSAFRLAEIYQRRKKYQTSMKILFSYFTANKKTPMTSIFENVVEILRSDIDRSGSQAYHMCKIVAQAITAATSATICTISIESLPVVLH